MQFRSAASLVIGIIAAMLASNSDARGIRVDSGNWINYASATESSTGAISFSGVSGVVGSANPGIGGSIPVWQSTTPFSVADDTGLFNIDQSNSVIYSWTTWSAPGSMPCPNPLSNCAATPIVAQVGVYTLAGNSGSVDLNGNPVDSDTEVIFNYPGLCPTSAQLTIFGNTYGFSAPTNSQCNTFASSSIYSNDFLFTPAGVEYINSPAAGEPTQLEAGLPPGWKLESTGVPEPGMLSLLGFGLAALGFIRRRIAR
jgi:hypothetical protein